MESTQPGDQTVRHEAERIRQRRQNERSGAVAAAVRSLRHEVLQRSLIEKAKADHSAVTDWLGEVHEPNFSANANITTEPGEHPKSAEGPKSILSPLTQVLPVHFAQELRQNETILSRPECRSSFAAAQVLLEHFMGHLTRHFRDPEHVYSASFLSELKQQIERVLYLKDGTALLAERESVPNAHFYKQARLVAVTLAMRVEFGQTSAPYDNNLMTYLSSFGGVN